MKTNRVRMTGLLATAMVSIAVVMGLSGCVEGASSVDRAKAQVTAKEKAVASAQAELDAASKQFCGASGDYIDALDRYGDVLNDTAPTVAEPTAAPTSAPLAPAATVDRVKQADADFEAAQASITEQTTLADASE